MLHGFSDGKKLESLDGVSQVFVACFFDFLQLLARQLSFKDGLLGSDLFQYAANVFIGNWVERKLARFRVFQHFLRKYLIEP